MESKSNWIWPRIYDKTSARKAVQLGAFWSLFTAGFIAILAIIGIHAIVGTERGALMNASFFALISWRLFRYSFPWAIMGLALIMMEVIWQITMTPRNIGLFHVFVILGFVHAIRGTYFLRKLKHEVKEMKAMNYSA